MAGPRLALDVFGACYGGDSPSILAGASQLLLVQSNMPLEIRVEACSGAGVRSEWHRALLLSHVAGVLSMTPRGLITPSTSVVKYQRVPGPVLHCHCMHTHYAPMVRCKGRRQSADSDLTEKSALTWMLYPYTCNKSREEIVHLHHSGDDNGKYKLPTTFSRHANLSSFVGVCSYAASS